VAQVGRVNEKKGQLNNSHVLGKASNKPIWSKTCMVGGVHNIITWAKFQIEIFWSYDFTGIRIFDFPIDIGRAILQCSAIMRCLWFLRKYDDDDDGGDDDDNDNAMLRYTYTLKSWTVSLVGPIRWIMKPKHQENIILCNSCRTTNSIIVKSLSVCWSHWEHG